jgi:hypothetical protein
MSTDLKDKIMLLSASVKLLLFEKKENEAIDVSLLCSCKYIYIY